MKIIRKSILTGVDNSMNIPVTEEQMLRFNNGESVQKVFPHLTVDQREFILNGITPEEWDTMIGPENDENILKYL